MKKKAKTEAKQPEKPKVGRPSSYKAEYAGQTEKLCKLGATDVDLADFFGVTINTIANWKVSHPEFLGALKSGKDEADDRVERSLYQRATGYTYDAVKIFMPANAPAPVYADYREHVPPDTTAMIFWLKNRRPDAWRDKSEQVIRRENALNELSGEELDARIAAALVRVESLASGEGRAAKGKEQPSHVRKFN